MILPCRTTRKAWYSWLLLLLLICCVTTGVHSSTTTTTPARRRLGLWPRRRRPPTQQQLVAIELKKQDEEQQALLLKRERLVHNCMSALDLTTTLLTTLYGFILIVYGHARFSGQVLIMTVMRAAGYSRLEHAVQEMRRNIRQSVRSTVFHAPSLILAKRALKDLQNRRQAAKTILRETKLAQQDGIVTKQEKRRLQKLQRAQVKKINKDIRRFQRGSNSIAKIWKTLDLQEGTEILRRLLFLLTAVLASGHSISIIGNVISAYCHFWSLGQYFMETNVRVGMPLSRLILQQTIDPMAITINNENPSPLRMMLARTIMYALAAFLILCRYRLGIMMNAAFLAATLVVRGVTSTLSVLDEWKRELQNNNNAEKQVDKKKKKQRQDNDEKKFVRCYSIPGYSGEVIISEFWIGVSTILLSMAGMYCSLSLKSDAPPSWLIPFVGVETAIAKLVVLADKM